MVPALRALYTPSEWEIFTAILFDRSYRFTVQAIENLLMRLKRYQRLMMCLSKCNIPPRVENMTRIKDLFENISNAI